VAPVTTGAAVFAGGGGGGGGGGGRCRAAAAAGAASAAHAASAIVNVTLRFILAASRKFKLPRRRRVAANEISERLG
jgi:hypothetical protein